jgi:hypothetical protein
MIHPVKIPITHKMGVRRSGLDRLDRMVKRGLDSSAIPLQELFNRTSLQ